MNIPITSDSLDDVIERVEQLETECEKQQLFDYAEQLRDAKSLLMSLKQDMELEEFNNNTEERDMV